MRNNERVIDYLLEEYSKPGMTSTFKEELLKHVKDPHGLKVLPPFGKRPYF